MAGCQSCLSPSSFTTCHAAAESLRPRDAGAAQGGAAQVLGPLAWDLRDRGEEELAEALIVLLEDADNGLGRDGLLALHADVVVGDRRDVRVAELELAGEMALGVGGHVDHL